MVWKKQTHCKKGHEFSEENVIIGSDGQRRCKKCKQERQTIRYENNKTEMYKKTRQWAIDHPERMRELGRNWDRKNQAKKTIYRKEKWWIPYIKKLKIDGLTHYGNGKLACVCCGETIVQFLTLDHTNGRKNTKDNGKRAWMLLQWLRANNYPEGYQTLCWNCNSGRQLNKGICPHKIIPEQTITITEDWSSN